MEQPLMNDYFVELKVLATTFTNADKEKYEQALVDYEEELEKYERMGLDNTPARPVPNMDKPEFKSMWINMGAMVILNFTEEWDKERDCPVIIIEYTDEDNSAVSQMQINTTITEWTNLLKSIGARFN